jgi:hypothetical protein
MRDDRAGVGQTGPNIVNLQVGVIVEDGFPCLSLVRRLRINSTEIRMPRIIGLPPKMSGLAVTRESSAPFVIAVSSGNVSRRTRQVRSVTRPRVFLPMAVGVQQLQVVERFLIIITAPKILDPTLRGCDLIQDCRRKSLFDGRLTGRNGD